MYAITNGEIVGEDEIASGMDLLIEDGAIADIVPAGKRRAPARGRRGRARPAT